MALGSTSGSADPRKSNRDRIIDSFMALLAERPFEEIGFGGIAAGAGLSLADCRTEFGSVLGVLAAHVKAVDRQVLAGGEADMAEEPPRERLFDVLMRRLEVLGPHKAAMGSLLRSATRNPGLALALNGLAVRSQQWMLTSADIDAAGSRGMLRAQGLGLLFASVLRVWVDDDDPGLARTMAALDRGLGRGARWVGLLDDLSRFKPRFCSSRDRHREADGRRAAEGAGDEPLVA